MESALTLAWTSLASGERDLLEQRARAMGASVMQVDTATLAASVLPLIARGALIIVVATDREASVALALGVDEVMRCGEITGASLDQAIASANARAAGRAARD